MSPARTQTRARRRRLAASHPDVPRCRGIIEGTEGDDVIAVKRALSRAGYVRWGAFTTDLGRIRRQGGETFPGRQEDYARHRVLRALPCSSRELEPGDLAFYGITFNRSPAFPGGSPTHVALYDGDGGVYSMGSSPMGHYPLEYRTGQPLPSLRDLNVPVSAWPRIATAAGRGRAHARPALVRLPRRALSHSRAAE